MTRRPLYRCAACDHVKVRRIGDRCTECIDTRRRAQPLVLSSVARQLRLQRQALARQNLTRVRRGGRPEKVCPNAPYEQAVRQVEQQSGCPRAEWESQMNHELTLAANQIARELAGIPELPTHYPKGVAA